MSEQKRMNELFQGLLTSNPIINLEFWKPGGKELDFSTQVLSGMTGDKTGLSVGLPRLERYFKGLQQSRYYLIGAESNVGKTTTADYMLIMAWLNAKRLNRAFKCFYFSLEVSATDKKAKWVSFFVYLKLGLLYSVDFILGRDRNNLPDSTALANIQLGYAFVEELLKDVYLYDHAVSAKSITDAMVAYYAQYGIIKRSTVTPNEAKAGVLGNITGFEANKPVPMVVLVIDHLGFLDGDDTKRAIDDMSSSAVELKRVFGMTPLFIQQFSGDQLQARRDSIVRHGSKATPMLMPNRMDFGDSKYTFRDADYVFGLVKPRMFQCTEYKGFSLESPENGGLGDFLLAIFLIKNRYGQKDLALSTFLHPANIIYELPSNFGGEQEWYDLAKKLVA